MEVFVYKMINVKVNGTWERTFTYQWMYMEKPELSSLEDVNNYIKIFKRREKLNNILES